MGSLVGVMDNVNSVRTCAYLDYVDNKTAVASVAWDDVRATITMFQQSPFDSTLTKVEVAGLEVNLEKHYL